MSSDTDHTPAEDAFDLIELGSVSEETRGYAGQGFEIEEGLSKVQP